MGTLTDEGYTQDTPLEIKTDLETEAAAQVDGYMLIPSELRQNLIQESVIIEMKMQDAVNSLMNGIGPDFANDFMFKQIGSSFGIIPKSASRGQVTLRFTGSPSTVIPVGTRARNAGSTTTVATMVRGIIGSTGVLDLLAESTSADVVPIPASTITTMVDIISGVTVTNPADGTAGLTDETIEEYKAAVYNEIQAPRYGSLTRAYSLLYEVSGVDPRLVFFRVHDLVITTEHYNGIECVVGGGDDDEVAGALLQAFLQTKNLISDPSNAEVARTVTKDVQIYNSTFPVSFTRPKLVQADMEVTIEIDGVTTSADIIQGVLLPAMEDYFDSLSVGRPINQASLNDIVYDTLKTANIFPYNISALSYSFDLDGTPTAFVGTYLPVEFDQYLNLQSFVVNLS